MTDDDTGVLREKGLKLAAEFKETSHALLGLVQSLRTQQGKIKEGDPVGTKLALLYMEYKARSRAIFAAMENSR